MAQLTSLRAFLEQENAWAGIFGQAPITATADNKEKILEMIECKLSPENLTCDGEASWDHIRKTKAFLERAKADAETL